MAWRSIFWLGSIGSFIIVMKLYSSFLRIVKYFLYALYWYSWFVILLKRSKIDKLYQHLDKSSWKNQVRRTGFLVVFLTLRVYFLPKTSPMGLCELTSVCGHWSWLGAWPRWPWLEGPYFGCNELTRCVWNFGGFNGLGCFWLVWPRLSYFLCNINWFRWQWSDHFHILRILGRSH